MRYLLAFLLGMATFWAVEVKTRPFYSDHGLVHDFVFRNAEELCKEHSGFHYLVTDTHIYSKESNYPCTDKYKIRCQDGYLTEFDTGTGYCFIMMDQLSETLLGKSIFKDKEE